MDRSSLAKVIEAAHDSSRVEGLTHNFYRYPARLSPVFASTAIREFCPEGGVVLDPFMGGGTVVVEALAQGRQAVGCDINSLAVFVTRVKSTPLSQRDVRLVRAWAEDTVPTLRSRGNEEAWNLLDDARANNLKRSGAVWLSALLAAGKLSAAQLPSERARDFALCALLAAGQWCLNGRNRATSVEELRGRISANALSMLESMGPLSEALKETRLSTGARRPKLLQRSSEYLKKADLPSGRLVDLVVTSPPYPGIHILYHRWQVDGRKETPAPYWIAGCDDGHPGSYYNMGPRKQRGHETYFSTIQRCFGAISRLLKPNALVVQLVSFSEPEWMVERYLEAMAIAGYRSVDALACSAPGSSSLVWRDVPSRSWHASLQTVRPGSKELLLVHRL